MIEVGRLLCFSVCFLICQVAGSNILRLTIGLCEEPIVGKPVRLCCKTEGLGMTGIRVQIPGSNMYTTSFVDCRNYTFTYYRSSYTYKKTVQVNCYTRYDVTVYAFTLTDSLVRDYRTWQCETYSNQKVSFRWSSIYRMRFTENQGSDAALNNTDATLTFDVPFSYNTIYLYRKYVVSPITHWTRTSGSSTIFVSPKYRIRKDYRKIYVTVFKATPDDVGTYWLEVDMGFYAEGKNISKSLVLFDSPSDIDVKPTNVFNQGSKLDATLDCDVTVDVSSKNMLVFLSIFSHNWLYPNTGSTYRVSRIQNGRVRVTGIDCSMYNLAPIGCSANVFGHNSSYYWYDVKELCAFPIPESSRDQETTTIETKTQTVETIPSTFSIVMSVISVLMFLLAISCLLFITRKSVCKPCTNSNPVGSIQRWWRNRPLGHQPLEEMPTEEEQNREQARPVQRSLSAQIHDRRRLHYTIQDETPATHRPGAVEQVPNIQPPFHTASSAVPPPVPVYQPYAQSVVPNTNGGYGQVPVSISPMDVNTGPGHMLGSCPETNRAAPLLDTLQHSTRVDLPPMIPVEPEFLSSSVNRNEQFAAEANLQSLHRSLKDEAIHIQVTRDGIVDDLINFYTTMDQSDAKKTVYCKFIGEEGLDAGGVTKDVFTTFWQKAIPKYFTGNIALVPKLSLHTYEISTFVTLGRILAHSTAILKAIPVQICRSTLNVVIFGEMEMVRDSEDIVIDDFLQYADSDVRRVLDKALANFDDLAQDEKNSLRNIFVNFDMPEIPRKENFRKNLASIAHNELCIKPKVVCDQMGKGIPEFHRQLFWGQMTILHIDGLYETFRPTPQKVVDKLKCLKWPLDRDSLEQKTFDNLKRFVTDMSTETLLKFLHFVTGERKVPNTEIKIEFTNATGVSRVPIAHTCSCHLELPKSYTNYEELRREFLAILNSDEAYFLQNY